MTNAAIALTTLEHYLLSQPPAHVRDVERHADYITFRSHNLIFRTGFPPSNASFLTIGAAFTNESGHDEATLRRIFDQVEDAVFFVKAGFIPGGRLYHLYVEHCLTGPYALSRSFGTLMSALYRGIAKLGEYLDAEPVGRPDEARAAAQRLIAEFERGH